MSVTTTTTRFASNAHYKDHKVVVHRHATNGWMTTMYDAAGKRLGEQFYAPSIDKDAVIERAITLAGWFGIDVDVREDA